MIRLLYNENFFIEKEWAYKLLREAIIDLDPREYPPEHGAAVRSVLADFLGLPEERLLIGNGAVEVIDLVATTYTCNSGCLVVQPTFGAYVRNIEKKGGKATNFLLKEDFSLELQALLEMIDETIGIIFLSSPNNPTGNQFPKETMKELLENIKIPLVVDEAYADFAPYSMLNWEYENLIVIRSFSKVAAAAGLRLGYVVANEKVVERLRQIQPLFSVSSIAQRYVIKILENYDYVRKKTAELKTERTRLFEQLQQVDGIQVYPSDASFFLMRIRNTSASDVVERLKEDGILVSNRSNDPLLENCIRVTIGTRPINETFVDALKRAL